MNVDLGIGGYLTRDIVFLRGAHAIHDDLTEGQSRMCQPGQRSLLHVPS